MFQNIFFLTIADLVKELAEEASSYVAFSLAVDESTDNVLFTGVCIQPNVYSNQNLSLVGCMSSAKLSAAICFCKMPHLSHMFLTAHNYLMYHRQKSVEQS